MGLGLQHWAGDSSHFSLEYYNVCLSQASVLSMAASRQLSLGAPGEPALPLHLLILTLHKVLMASSHS